MIDNIKDFIEEKHYEYTFNEWLKKQIFARDKEIERLHSIIKEVREYIENNWISQKDADIHRFDNEEMEMEIGDIAVILEILDKE